MEYLGGPSVFYQPNDAEVDTVPNFKVKEEPDQDTNKQLESKDKRLESKTEEATIKELTVKNIKSEPGISYTTTEEEIDTAGLNGPTLKIESLSEVWDWDPNDETKTAASSETTIRIESVSGATVSNKDIDSDDKKVRGARLKEAQKRPLFNAVAARPRLIFNAKFSSKFTPKDCDRLWQEVANEVNADRSGPPKTAGQWQKAWGAQKRSAKSHGAALYSSMQATGGVAWRSREKVAPLTPLEEEILAYMGGIGGVVVARDSTVPVSQIVHGKAVYTERFSTREENGDAEVTDLDESSEPVLIPQQYLDHVSVKRKSKEPVVGAWETPAKRVAEDLARYQRDLIRLKTEELEIKKRRLALEERKVVALESISKSLVKNNGR